jgi:hypothetical protein
MSRILNIDLRPALLALLLLACCCLVGCDAGGQSDPVGSAPPPAGPGPAQPNPTVTVSLETAAAGVSGLTDFQVIAYDVRGAELDRRTVVVGQNAVFEDLPAGSVQIRVIGSDSNGAILGFCDASVAVPGDTRVEAPPLTLGDQVPPPATPGTSFLAFTGLPASFQAGVSYSIEVSAFDAQGHLDTSANGSVGLSSSGVSAVMPEIGVLFTEGRATFPSLVFPQGSNGTVTFTASAEGFQSAVSPTLPVRSN